jgi:hypothetical protein
MEKESYQGAWRRADDDLKRIAASLRERLLKTKGFVDSREDEIRDLYRQRSEIRENEERIANTLEVHNQATIAGEMAADISGFTRAVEEPFFARIKATDRHPYYISQHVTEPSIGLISYTAPLAGLRFNRVGENHGRDTVLEKEEFGTRRDALLWMKHRDQSRDYEYDGNNVREREPNMSKGPIDIEVKKESANKTAVVASDSAAADVVRPPKPHQHVLGGIAREMREEQDDVMRADHKGVLLIEGSAGSGKTNIAFHRLDYLVKELHFHPETMAVFCYNVSLKKYLESVRKDLGLNAVQVHSIDSWANALVKEATLEKHEVKIKVWDKNKGSYRSGKRLETKVGGKPGLRVEYYEGPFDELLRRKEIIKVLEDFYREMPKSNLTKWKQARTFLDDFFASDIFINHAVAAGFKGRIDDNELAPKRNDAGSVSGSEASMLAWWLVAKEKWVWEIVDKKWVTEEDWNKKNKGNEELKTFSHILVDEAQDMTPVQMALLNRVHHNSMTLVGDITQAIYSHGLTSWEDLGIRISSRITLKTTHRSSLETMLFANALAGRITSGVSADKVSSRGLRPSLFIANNHASALKQASSIIGGIKRADPESSIAVAFPSNKLVEGSLLELKKSGVDAYIAKGDAWVFSSKVHLTTYLQMKGLEFDYVIVMGLNDFETWRILPNKNQIVYTAVTRARKRVYIIAEGRLPKMLEGIDPELYDLS